MALNLYLSELNATQNNTTSGSFIGANTNPIASTHENLYYSAPLGDWQRIFKFYTDGGTDITAEGVTLFTAQGQDIIGDTTADWNDTRVSLLYAPNLATDASYIPNVINDVSASLGTTEDPAAALDFTQELARAVFGSTEAVDMFSNESDIASSYGTAIESCATAISNEFSSAGDKTMHSAINSNSEKKLQTVKKIYDQLRFNALGYGTPLTRFTMGFTAGFKVGTTAFDQESGLSVTREDGGATGGATVNVLMSGTTIDSIVVNTTGSGFTKEDKIYITDSNNHIIEITSITDVQASMLNGTLDSDSGTELPLLVDDYFHILLTINSNALQKDAAGGVIYDRGDQVSRTIDLHVRLQ